jgi:hypothetical protein
MADEFSKSAAAAAARISSLNPAEALAQMLANDRPTIESAIKSFMSLVAARSLTSTKSDHIQSDSSSDGRDADNNTRTAGSRPKEDADSTVSSSFGQTRCVFRSGRDANKEALLCARALLQATNQFQIPQDDNQDILSHKSASAPESTEEEEVRLERQVVRLVWNGLISSDQKPAKFLGRRSLHYVYPAILQQLLLVRADNNDDEEHVLFFQEFGRLLEEAMRKSPSFGVVNTKNEHDEDDDTNQNTDSDACLLWDADGGAGELARRRKRRSQRVAHAKKGDAAAANEIRAAVTAGFSSLAVAPPSFVPNSELTIEEITEENDTDETEIV